MKYKIKYKIISLKENTVKIKSPEEIYRLMEDEKNDYQEVFYIIGLNNQNETVLKHLIAKRTHNAIMVTAREIFIPLLHNLCTSFTLVHNHPSGCTEPSEDDLHFTERIKEASKIMGINLLDHIIISPNGFYSFLAGGLL